MGDPMWLWENGRESLRDRWTQTRREEADSGGAGPGQGRQWNKALCMICLADSSHLGATRPRHSLQQALLFRLEKRITDCYFKVWKLLEPGQA